MKPSLLEARLRKILPFIGRNTGYVDRDIAVKAFRTLYSEEPYAFYDAYDRVMAEFARTLPREVYDLIDQAALSELDDQMIAVEREDGSVTTLYAAGFLAFGLENQPLASEKLTEEQAAKFRELLLAEYFDSSVQIQVYENLIAINHKILADSAESLRFLRLMMKSKADFVPEISSVDMPGIDFILDEEEATATAARFRLILFTVRSKPGCRTMKEPFRFMGFCVPGAAEGEPPVLSTDAIVRTRWGAEFTALISRVCGRGLRYAVTEPTLVNDTVRQLDYIVGLKRVMVTFTRLALDENVAPESILVSMAAFSDPQKGYSELRVAFALPSAPDELLAGVPIPLPSGSNIQGAVEEIAAMICDLFTLEGINLRHPIRPECQWLTAEPDTVDRLYNSVNNVQKPLRKHDNSPRPSMPSMLLN
ncbi:hypothetical protein [Sutterella sp.]|uniref:hypothetical protein n=1 Tax=Sutterella sp. TaxID=1981025 RepID=UPI0026E0C871|nr:hypothetical protein [Sutterella sp.]MDO5531574.1 hypothetical protein [Sutterella sp.]